MRLILPSFCLLVTAGCAAIPDVVHQPQIHNPFPQLSRVAVLPFYNQSAEPTVDQDQVAMAYFNELQAVPGFEVVPVGVAKHMAAASGIEPRTPRDFQELARFMDVDAVVVGSVTEFTPYYPPRLGLAVRWYAANPSFHPIPPGYGLPWGTTEEEFIPASLVFDAEFALAKEQLATQTPKLPQPNAQHAYPERQASLAEGHGDDLPPVPLESIPAGEPLDPSVFSQADSSTWAVPSELPPDWPDPSGFIPPAPQTDRPLTRPQYEPVLSHTRLFHGNDAEFTKRLANYFYFRDDARFGGWQAYLQRTDDFIRFCCHMHISEMLAGRGGAGKTQVVWRWPIGRYDR